MKVKEGNGISMRKKWLVYLFCGLLLSAQLVGCGTEPADSSGQEQLAEKESGDIENFDAAEIEQDITDGAAGTGSSLGLGQQPENNPDEDMFALEPEPVPEITLIMVGDILLHTPVAKSAQTEDGGYDFSAIFENVKEEISEADLALVNQEVIIGGAQLGVTGYPSFNAPYELGDALDEAGFDVILHATNHTLDKGKRGLLNCLDFWQENYPEKAVLGIHDSEEDQGEIYVYEQDGIKIAILNYT